MCWSGEASAALATVGFISTGYAVHMKQSMLLWAPLGYFALMEALQAFTYTVIDNGVGEGLQRLHQREIAQRRPEQHGLLHVHGIPRAYKSDRRQRRRRFSAPTHSLS